MKVLVTGASGFMASHFIDLLKKDRVDFRVFQGDITLKEDVIRNMRDIDVVVNFAALTYVPPSWENPEAYSRVNYEGVLNLLQAHEMFNRFIQISTSHVYGNQRPPLDLDMTIPRPADPYSIAKLMAEKAVQDYGEKHGFGTLIVRPFNNFGPRQSRHFVIPTFALQALKGGPIVVRGSSKREFIYVKDNVRLLKHFLDTGRMGFAQVCKGINYRVWDVAEMIARTVDPKIRVVWGDTTRTHDIDELLGVPFGVPIDFKWTPMEKALKETVDYYRHPD